MAVLNVLFIFYKPLSSLPRVGLFVDVDFGLWPYIRCSGGCMNIHVYGRALQRQHIAAGY